MLLAAVLHLGDVHFTPLTDADTAFPSDLQLLERGQCHRLKWDWTESWVFISRGMEKHTCFFFPAFPRLPHYTTQPCDPVTSDIRETVNKWHQLLNGNEPCVVLETWCHGRRCQRWDPGLLSPPLLVNSFCSEIRWWLISASSADRWGTNEPPWGSWRAGSVASLSGQRAVPWKSSVLPSLQLWYGAILMLCCFCPWFLFLCRVCLPSFWTVASVPQWSQQCPHLWRSVLQRYVLIRPRHSLSIGPMAP